MPKASKFRLLSLFRADGAALCLRLILGATMFWVVGCKKAAPPVARINPDAIRVTAISLGQPRLAIVNGRQLGEGDEVIAAATRLRIVKISDGEVELSTGAQVVLAHLTAAKMPPAKR
jgi:hypothetical protein